ncbi:hypothetical protein D3C71_77200 [compost metagenome]
MKEIFVTAWVIATMTSARQIVVDDVSYDLKVAVGVDDDGRQQALKVAKAVQAHVVEKEALAPWVKHYRRDPKDFTFSVHFKVHETEKQA